MVVVKPKHSKMIFENCSLSYPRSFSLTHALQLSMSDCVINRKDHSLFILVFDFYNYLPRPTSLREYNNPSAPQLWGLFPLINKEG